MLPRLVATPLLLSLLAGFAAAQEVKLYGAHEAVDPQEVARILDRSAAPVPKTRSVRLARRQRVGRASLPGSSPKRGSRRRRRWRCRCSSSSTRPRSCRRRASSSTRLAAGIRLLPPTRPVVIEGHTDAAGSDVYNEGLSTRRAHAVKRYLVAQHGIESDRLRAARTRRIRDVARPRPACGGEPPCAVPRRVKPQPTNINSRRPGDYHARTTVVRKRAADGQRRRVAPAWPHRARRRSRLSRALPRVLPQAVRLRAEAARRPRPSRGNRGRHPV